MKIGILTFHRAHNYGAVLQSYAMKVVFSRYGKAEIIDYWPSYHHDEYSLIDLRFLKKSLSLKLRFSLLRSSFRRALLLPIRTQRSRKYRSFMNTHFWVGSRTPITCQTNLPQNFDAYVFGSDQIWRAFNLRNDPCPDLVYLGSEVPAGKRKISYAASMGEVRNDTLQEPGVSKLLEEFDFLSVREDRLKQEIFKFSSRPVTEVLDPTLLMSRQEWTELADNAPNKQTQPYLLFYSLIDSPESRRIAKKLSRELGLQLVEINGFGSIRGIFNRTLVQTAGPIDFLQLIRNADFVVSTSFHGVVFSIIFQKNFFACGMGRHSGRVVNLLEMLGLREQMIDNETLARSNVSIDYDIVRTRLSGMKEQSEQFIRAALT